MRTHGKPRCPGCFKHPDVCLCRGIEPLPTPHRVLIVQHPTEVWRSSATAGLATRLFPGSCELVVRGDPQGEELLGRRLADPSLEPYILFPDPGATEVGELAAKGFEPGRTPLFIVLDGSWRQARRMRRRIGALEGLPVVGLEPASASSYRVRRQTRPANLSTAEAVALLLGRLDGLDGPHPALQALFDDWIERVLVLRGLARQRPRLGTTGEQR